MGLVISHGAFEGGYIRFNRFRGDLLEAIGGSFPPHKNNKLSENRWYWQDNGKESLLYNRDNYRGIYEFLSHSDCDGMISLELVKLLYKELNELLPIILKFSKTNRKQELLVNTMNLINGCELAILNSENLSFL